MNRRHLLEAGLLAGLGTACGAVAVPPAWAMGGQLPELETLAPDFRLPALIPAPAESGRGALRNPPTSATLALGEFRSRWLVLYFYPRDFTGGCTLEARGFQQELSSFRARNAEVAGVSADALDAHASFCAREGLAFPLLSDPGGRVSARYGSWIPPFSQRHTFLIDPAGRLRARWVAVRPVGHGREVLAELVRLQS